MKTYKVPVVYQMYGYVYVQAESMAEAVDEVRTGDGALPDTADYVEGSFEVDLDGRRGNGLSN
jgi:pseudouridine-5'-phosphate glycosidase